jgi:hypothetical protein
MHSEVPMEESSDEKPAVVARTVGRWRWIMCWEGGWSSGRASLRRGGAE